MADATLQEALEALEQAAPIVRAGQYLTLSGVSLLLYDYSLTIHQEVELIWKAPKSHISFIFLANRYIVPLMLAVDIYGLVAMRVHALFGGGKRIKLLLWSSWVVYVILTMILLGIALWHGQATLTVEPYFNTCYEEISSMLWTVWLPSLLLESLLFTLTTLKAIREAKNNVYHPITSILYRDGILYFLTFSMSTLFCMFVWMVGTNESVGLAKYWATAVVNVAGSRLVLSLKANARAFQTSRSRTRVTVGQSSSFLIGSMWTFNDPQFRDSGCGMSDDYLLDCDGGKLYELPQLGTVYPEEVQTHWEAI
ncbi:hypothetical protein A7U60_g1034 [Sanghuangporus baumii]|uniref:DUF6533 domain-containing protein n=1 Tax=Sanghuangporus baumii TaxID=108892 RepID=A0A9Q5NBJ9_SANBA|nr:hypothetical protein A7U60_g1034 [Sanghuangporus baumii]